jgi:hypothetical protein
MAFYDVTAWVRKGSRNGNWIVWVGTRGFLEAPFTSYGSKTAATEHARQIRSALQQPVGLNTRAK